MPRYDETVSRGPIIVETTTSFTGEERHGAPHTVNVGELLAVLSYFPDFYVCRLAGNMALFVDIDTLDHSTKLFLR